jgi:hypothetical protein
VEVAKDALYCAHPFVFSLSFQYPAKRGREELLTAAVERGPSEGARSGSKETSSRPRATPDSFPFGSFRDEPNGCKGMVYRRIEFFVRTC